MAIISVIVPVYNISSYLSQCVESLINQSFRDIEIILVDDGSTDASGDICDRFAQKDVRIKVIHKENEGLVKARKSGLRAAGGQYIGYVDGDDWVEQNMFQRLYDIIEREQVDIVACGRFEDTGAASREVFHGLPEGKYSKQQLLESVYPYMIVNKEFFEWGLFPSVWDKLFRRECLEAFQMAVDDRLTMGEDAACVYPCVLNADSIYVLQECLYHYRQSSGSMVRKAGDKRIERERFSVLYETVNSVFFRDRDIYDLRGQWLEYLLFLMVPRADSLYRDIEDLDYLFPFPGVKKGSKIIIYGAGTYGQRLYNYLDRTGFCRVEALADRNYIELDKQGIPAVSPEKISDFHYDAIVIASSFAKTRNAIYRDLTAVFPKDKIHVMDEILIKSKDTLKAFGLL